MTDPLHISSDDLALLALGALSPAEAAAFTPHLSGCEQCRHELAELRGDMSLLAFTAPIKPLPAAARERFVASIGAAPATEQFARPGRTSVTPMPPRSSSGALRLWQAVAAVLLLALGLHAYKVHQLQTRLHEDQSRIAALRNDNEALRAGSDRERQVFQVLTAPDAQHVMLSSTHAKPEPEGHLTYIAASGALIFQANHLRPLPEGKTYELWIIPANGTAPLPAGLFQPDAAGHGAVVLPKIPQGIAAKAFGVTMENAAGATTPTLPILLSGAPG
jgi:outer membrane murein-binding lipoprotein Lpp